MKQITATLRGWLVLVAFSAFIGISPAATAGNQKASGECIADTRGTFAYYAFNAIEHQDGSVTGNFFLTDPILTFAGTVDCLYIEGNNAWVGGVLTYSTDGGIPVGYRFLIRFTDRGEGANAAPDSLTVMGASGSSNWTCHNPASRQWIENVQAGAGGDFFVVSGNIKVKG